MQAVILAGGQGIRLNHLAAHTPKPMAPLFDRPVLEHIVRYLARQDVRDIVVTAPYPSSDLVSHLGDGSRWGVRIRYSIEREPRGCAGAVRQVRQMLDERFLVVSGDLAVDFELAPAITGHKASGAVATVLTHNVDDVADFGLIECGPDFRMTRIAEKPRVSETRSGTVNSGVYLLEKDALGSVRSDRRSDFATDLLPRLLTNGDRVSTYPIPGYWRDIGNIHDYRQAHFDALDGKLRLELPAVHVGEGIWLGEGVDIHSTAELSSPVYIGSRATIGRNAILDQYAIIGAGTIVDECVRVSGSVIGSGALLVGDTPITNAVIAGSARLVEERATPSPRPSQQQPLRLPSNSRLAA